MDEELKKLHADLRRLQEALRAQTLDKYRRMNPFVEDLFDWKERGAFWAGENKDVTIYNSAVVLGDVSIGQGTWVGPNSALDGTGGLSIGAFCSISSGVQIVTHDTVKWALSGGKVPPEVAPIRIGDRCYIGSHAVITKGVRIGSHCIIGAGAVVTRDIPSFSIVAGVPGRIIGRVIMGADGDISLTYGNS